MTDDIDDLTIDEAIAIVKMDIVNHMETTKTPATTQGLAVATQTDEPIVMDLCRQLCADGPLVAINMYAERAYALRWNDDSQRPSDMRGSA